MKMTKKDIIEKIKIEIENRNKEFEKVAIELNEMADAINEEEYFKGNIIAKTYQDNLIIESIKCFNSHRRWVFSYDKYERLYYEVTRYNPIGVMDSKTPNDFFKNIVEKLLNL